MTDHLPFGTPVTVSHRVEARYLRWHTTRQVDAGPGLFGPIRRVETVTLDTPVLGIADPQFPDLGIDTAIGFPCPGAEPVPEKGTYRRLRRYADRASGLVVGWVWRAEGQYHAAIRGGYSIDGDYDAEQAFLAESGRIRLYQVAVDPGEVGDRFHPARIALAHPNDVEAR